MIKGKRYYIDNMNIVTAIYETNTDTQCVFKIRYKGRTHFIFKPIKEYKRFKWWHLIFGQVFDKSK